MSRGTQLCALVSWPFVDAASNGPRVRIVWNLLELSEPTTTLGTWTFEGWPPAGAALSFPWRFLHAACQHVHLLRGADHRGEA